MNLTRRSLIKASFAIAFSSAVPHIASSSVPQERWLHFHNTHTHEKVSALYWRGGAYRKEGLKAIAHALRDHRTNEMRAMDTGLLDLLFALGRRMGKHQTFEVISGYRSPKTNAMLYETTSGVARGSLHMEGRAIDVRIAGLSTQALRDTAWNLQLGGVGYYPASDFVHLDTGKARQW